LLNKSSGVTKLIAIFTKDLVTLSCVELIFDCDDEQTHKNLSLLLIFENNIKEISQAFLVTL